MLKTRALLGFILMAIVFIACEKAVPYDAASQMEIDDALIVKYELDSNVKLTKHSSGLYYNIIRMGAGDAITITDTVKAKYTLKVLRDSVVRDQSQDSTFMFMLPGYMPGWVTGVSLIRPGGKIRLVIPSPLGYQQRPIQSPLIPPNSILDITLDIISVKKNNKTK